MSPPPRDEQPSVAQWFGQHADWYATSAVHSQAASLDRLVALVEPVAGERVVDIATGTGHTAAALKRAQPDLIVLATDLTRAMLERARTDYGSLGIAFAQADAERLPLATASLHAVVSRSAPHHFPRMAAFFDEVRRVLVPGGRLVISDPSCVEDADVDAWLNAAEVVHDPSHFKNYRLSEWRSMVDSSGLVWEQGDDQTRHTRVYSRWMQVVRDQAQVDDLRRQFLEAPEGVKTALELQISDGSPPEITYTVPQAIFRATKPA